MVTSSPPVPWSYPDVGLELARIGNREVVADLRRLIKPGVLVDRDLVGP